MVHSIIKKISLEIDKNKERRHVIIANKNISKRFLYSSLEKVNNKNLKIYTPDEYIFHLNNEEIGFYRNKDLIFLENILTKTQSFLSKYNYIDEIENIYESINQVIVNNEIHNSDEKNVLEKIKYLEKNVLSYESKIFLEVIKLWMKYTIDEESYINKYISLLKENFTLFSDAVHHVINIQDFYEIERLWINKNIPNVLRYKNANFELKSENDISDIDMEKYNSHDFFSHEDELSFLANDICIQNKNEKIKNIGLITNDRYFARRLRALLARNNIDVNDDSGWVLSTSSCCSYINNIINYFFENNSYSSLRDILKSPYFQIKMSNHEKNKLLEKIVLHQKGNININIVNFKNKNKFFDEYFESKTNLEDRCSFNNIKNFIENKLKDFKSYEIITNDSAGKEFLRILEFININSFNQEKNINEWCKIIRRKLEKNTFSNKNDSKVTYTNIQQALIKSFDKIYICSMSSKNYPKKIINNFSEKNTIFSELSISSNVLEKETISDFFQISKFSNSICLSFHKNDNSEIFSKSKFKLVADNILNKKFVKNKIPDKKPLILRNKLIDYICLDNTFKKLNYKDIENFRDCLYSFYRGKKFPESFSRVSNKYLIFGTYIHSILKNTAEKIGNNKDEKLVIEALISSTEDLEDTFYLSNDIPYEIELWKKLIPEVAKEVFCNSEDILRSDFRPERSISRIYNNIKLVGRYDLKYKMNGQVAIIDFKVSSNLPSKKSIMDGDHLQLPFYALIEPEVELFEYYFINISKNTTKRISFSRDDFEPIIENLKTYIDEINMHIENKTKFSIERSDDDEIKLIEV